MAKVDLSDRSGAMVAVDVPTQEAFAGALSRTPLGSMANRFQAAVARDSTVPGRVAEAARMRIARINGCMLCMSARLGPDGERLSEDFYEHVVEWSTWPGYSERESLAMEFAERFALDHLAIDDDLWSRLRAVFSDDQLIDLGLSIAEWLGIGRFTQVLGLDRVCTPAVRSK